MSARECVIPVFVPHLGCPHACVFCDQNCITGQRGSVDGDTVRGAVLAAEGLSQPGRTRQLAFYGGSFTAIPTSLQEELLSAAAEAIQEGRIDSVRLSTRPDAVEEESLARLARYGVETVELGAQSMDEEVLRLSGRGHSAADVERAAALVKRAGFRLILQMMTGLPGDSGEKSLETARRLIGLQPDGVRIYPTVIVRGTAMHRMWLQGAYREHSLEEAVELCARILPLFEQAGIPVIRLGLNLSEDLSKGAAVAGAYHPALGELVRSRVLRNAAEQLLREVPAGSSVTLGVPEARLSQMIGQHRENLRYLRDRFGLAGLKVRPCGTKNERIQLLSIEKA